MVRILYCQMTGIQQNWFTLKGGVQVRISGSMAQKRSAEEAMTALESEISVKDSLSKETLCQCLILESEKGFWMSPYFSSGRNLVTNIHNLGFENRCLFAF